MDHAVIAASEQSDIGAWADMYAAAPAPFRAQHNLAASMRGGALILTSTGLPLGHFNSMIGLGAGAPATPAQIDDAVETFRRANAARYVIHIVPGDQARELELWLAERELHPAGAWDRIARGKEPLSTREPEDFAVERVSASNASEWARFVDRIYGLHNEPWLTALVGRKGWSHYVLRDAGEIAAARSMYITAERRAWLGIDAPVPGLMTDRFDRDFRLCEAMIADGLREEVDRFFTDIEAPSPDRRGPAYEGFARLGFEPIYLRRHFVPAP